MKKYIEQENEDPFKLNKQFIAIFNDRLDSISIRNCYKRCYPNPDGCKLIEFAFTTHFMKSHSVIIRNYLSQIHDRTKINLFIGRKAYN